MKNKKGNVAVIAAIVVIVAITAGVFGWMFAKKSSVPEQEMGKIEAKKEVKDETVDWLVYRDEEFGYEIKYPQDWTIENGNLRPRNPKNCSPNIDSQNPQPMCLDGVDFTFYSNSKNLAIKDFFKEMDWEVDGTLFYKDLKEYKINGINGYTAITISSYDGSESEALFIPIKNSGYIALQGNYLNAEQKDVFKKIISTVKIIPISNSYWQIYKNEKYGFEMKVPRLIDGKNFKVVESGDLTWFSIEDLSYQGYLDDFKIFQSTNNNNEKKAWDIPWVFYSRNINNDQDLDSMIKDVYGKECKLGVKTIDVDSGLYDIGIVPVKEIEEDGIPSESGCFLNWAIFFKYSSENKVAILANLGQDASFASEGRSIIYDQIILNSFKFTK